MGGRAIGDGPTDRQTTAPVDATGGVAGTAEESRGGIHPRRRQSISESDLRCHACPPACLLPPPALVDDTDTADDLMYENGGKSTWESAAATGEKSEAMPSRSQK